MMRRAFRFLSSEASTLERAVSILAASAFLSSLLALLRDRLLAHTFGAGVELDVYYAAFRIPDLLFVTAGALVSVYILIPELARRDREQQKDYIDTVLAGFSLLAIFVSLLAAVFAPSILKMLFPALAEGGYLETLVLLTRIMLLQPMLLGAFFHLGIQVPPILADGFFQRSPRLIEKEALVRTPAISVPRALALSL